MTNTMLITVSDDRSGRKGGKYSETQNKIENIIKNNSQFGINRYKKWTFQDILPTDFYIKNKILLDNIQPDKNGRAYKPYIILESFKELNDGDFLIYQDCSPELWSYNYNYFEYDLNIIKNLCVQNNGILTAHVKWNHDIHVEKGQVGFHIHENFTTIRCIKKMGLEQYKHSLQHASGMIVLQKTNKSLQFIEEWLYWNTIDECASLGYAHIDGDYSFFENEPNLIGHRHDQSISGLLINKMGNKIIETLDYYERDANTSPYHFINFCKPGFNYNFFDSNQPMRNRVFKITKDRDINGNNIILVSKRQ